MDHLKVHNQLAAAVVDDQSAHATTTLLKGLADAAEQTTLGDDLQTLLDVAALGHGDDAAVIEEVEDAVGLVDGTQHGLDDDGGRRVGDEGRLLLQLAREQVDTEVAVLAGLGGDGDADDLAGAALEDQDVADADVVTGDGDGVLGGAGARLHDADFLTDAITETNWATVVSNDGVLTVVMMMVVMVEGVHDAVGSALHTTPEGVVVTVVVVVTHLARGLVNYGV